MVKRGFESVKNKRGIPEVGNFFGSFVGGFRNVGEEEPDLKGLSGSRRN